MVKWRHMTELDRMQSNGVDLICYLDIIEKPENNGSRSCRENATIK